MSANNCIWLVKNKIYYYVWYSPCADNVPTEIDSKAFGWRYYKNRERALLYAYELMNYLETEWSDEDGYFIVEHGVNELRL